MSMSDETLPNVYVLYNAKASVFGKIDYACRKLTSSADSPACSACDLTHGGLHLNETKAWSKAKGLIGANVYQLHRDELTPEVQTFVKEKAIRFPAVLGQAPKGPLQLLIDSDSLKSLSEDHTAFLHELSGSAEREGITIHIQQEENDPLKMFDQALRQTKDRVMAPLIELTPSNITPGHLTAMGFSVGLLACALASFPATASFAVYAWLGNRLLDCLDGGVARKRNMTSQLGGFCDLLCDFIVYSGIPIAVAYSQAPDARRAGNETGMWLSVAFLEATFHINNFVLFYCAAVMGKEATELTSVAMKTALVEGFESGIAFTAMLVWPYHIATFSWFMGVMVVVGIVQRSLAISAVFIKLDIKE